VGYTGRVSSIPRPPSVRPLPAALSLLPAFGWMAFIFALSAQRALPSAPGLGATLTAVGGHLAVYAVLAALLARGLRGTGLEGRRRFAAAFVVAVLYGVSDEVHQSFVPGRDATLADLGLDTAGAALALAGVAWSERRRAGPATRA
jgi:VanZ family protein